ncbi:MAG: hypothetical protein CMK09_18140 [Ponticaulis sp.]|nr:hypothetical protein [Ponticaulis sp.]|tara:strand:+ start:4276 stop:4893 length:618 start_codon:yes stop_codon:yes gene_type:complete
MKRQRGRGRKPSNPGNRSYESNGPDVKIRGTANQIYEKYLQYGRDAQTSGDRINAEAYFQHAEHYYRIIAANMPKDRQQNNSDDQDGRNDGDDTRNEDRNAEASDSQDNNDGNSESRSSQSGGDDGLQVVDGDGDSPDNVSADNNSDDGNAPAPRRRRSRRSSTRNSNSEGDASEAKAEDDDAGLRAMMARSSDDVSSSAEPVDS